MNLTVWGAFALGGLTVAVIAAATWWLNERQRRAARARLADEFAAQLRAFELALEPRLEARIAEAGAQLQERLAAAGAQMEAQLAEALRSHVQRAEQDLAALRGEQGNARAGLQSHVQAQLDTLRAETGGRLAANDQAHQQEHLALRGELATHRGEVLQHLQKQDETLRAEFGEFRRTVEGLWEAHYGHVEAYVKHRVEAAQKMTELGVRIHAAEAIARQVEETVWEIRGVPLNVLRSQLLVLQSALDAGEERRIGMVLGRIPRTLDALQTAGQRLDPWTLDRTREALERAEPLAPEAVKGIRRTLDRMTAPPPTEPPSEHPPEHPLPATSSPS